MEENYVGSKNKKYIIITLIITQVILTAIILRFYISYRQVDYRDLATSVGRAIEGELQDLIFDIQDLINEGNGESLVGYPEKDILNSWMSREHPEVNKVYIISKGMEPELVTRSEEFKTFVDYGYLEKSYNESVKKQEGRSSGGNLNILKGENDTTLNLYLSHKVNEKLKFIVININFETIFRKVTDKDVYNKYDFRILWDDNELVWGDNNFSKKSFSQTININHKNINIDIKVKDNIYNKIKISRALVLVIIGVFFILFNSTLFVVLKKNKNILELRKLKKKLEEEVNARKEAEDRYRLAIDGANDIIWEYDEVKQVLTLSEKWTAITRANKIEYNKDEIREELYKVAYKQDIRGILALMDKCANRSLDEFKYDFRVSGKDGITLWMYVRGKCKYDENHNLIKVAGSITDITDNKIKEKHIEYLAYHDHLTGLKNVKGFVEYIEDTLEKCKEENSKAAVLFLDLDNFKGFNDTLGHDFGDKVLKKVANAIYYVVKNHGSVSRIAGDEFVIVLDKFKTFKELHEICDKIIDLFKEDFLVDERKVSVTVSMGVSIYPCHSTESDQLLSNSDIAMYRAKSEGKNRYRIFEPKFLELTHKKHNMEMGIARALKEEEFQIYYQPKIDVKNGKIDGYEALIRWYSKEKEAFISPMEFIPIAEEFGLIDHIGYWIIEEVARQIKIWKSRDMECNRIAINISPIQLINKSFMDKTLEILESYDVSPKDIELEITETTYMKDINKNKILLQELRELGFRVALDDFGTGYSSLSYLINIPIDTLKIDKSFIDDITKNELKKDIVEAVTTLSHSIGLTVVAEGVENYKEVKLLKELNCDVIQGYYFSKPMPPREVEKFYKEYKEKLKIKK